MENQTGKIIEHEMGTGGYRGMYITNFSVPQIEHAMYIHSPIVLKNPTYSQQKPYQKPSFIYAGPTGVAIAFAWGPSI